MVYFVATPIGNLSEITLRALEVLKSVDAIFCEDTRHSQILLNHFEISKKLFSYHKFNERASVDFILEKAENGNIAVISDAGMPAISDPGNILVNALKEKKLPYTVVSGASALLNAFVLSGYEAPFSFLGFLPEKNRRGLLSNVNTNGVLIFYMSVHNLKKDFDFLLSELGDRDCCLCKELSKIHEEVFFLKLSEVPDLPKGEFVLVVNRAETNPLCSLGVFDHVNHYLKCGMSKNDAIKQTAKDRGVNKNEIYKVIVNE